MIVTGDAVGCVKFFDSDLKMLNWYACTHKKPLQHSQYHSSISPLGMTIWSLDQLYLCRLLMCPTQPNWSCKSNIHKLDYFYNHAILPGFVYVLYVCMYDMYLANMCNNYCHYPGVSTVQRQLNNSQALAIFWPIKIHYYTKQEFIKSRSSFGLDELLDEVIVQ